MPEPLALPFFKAYEMAPAFLPSACPHDCPSTCALEVERLDDHTIGKVRGAADNDYTLGVICDKVARYRERVHHPDRLSRPLVGADPAPPAGGAVFHDTAVWLRAETGGDA